MKRLALHGVVPVAYSTLKRVHLHTKESLAEPEGHVYASQVAACEAGSGDDWMIKLARQAQEFVSAVSGVDVVLTPSSVAAELRPDLDAASAAEIYTGTLFHRDEQL